MSILDPDSYCIPHRKRFLGNFEGWDLTLVAYKCISVSLKNLQFLLKVFHKMLINSFATHKDNT